MSRRPRHHAANGDRHVKASVKLRVSLDQLLAEAGEAQGPPPEVRLVGTRDTCKNGLERDYYQHLSDLRRAGEIHDFRYEPMGLRIGFNCRFHVDFVVIYPDGRVCLHEVKGGRIEDDAVVKLKVVATLYPWFPLYLVRRPRVGSPWQVERINPSTLL